MQKTTEDMLVTCATLSSMALRWDKGDCTVVAAMGALHEAETALMRIRHTLQRSVAGDRFSTS